MTILTISNLSCGYQGSEKVLQNLDLSMQQNEILCLLGASGCGKTTLLRSIAGLQEIQQGDIIFEQRNIAKLAVENRKIGVIFQDYALFPHLTVQDNIGFGLQNKSAVEKQKIIEKMTALVRLNGLLERYPYELSGGQQQRVAIARALACEPKLLLLDEPFSNIDTQVRYQMIDEIKAILKSQQIPAIFVTHSKEEAFAFADRLAIMEQGKIVQVGEAEQLYQQPINEFVAEFLGNVNYVKVQIKDKNQLHSPWGLQTFSQPLVLSNGKSVEIEQWVHWLIRPQHFSLIRDGKSDGEIVKKRFLGAFSQYDVAFNNQIYHVQSTEYFNLGERVALNYICEQPVLFETVE